VVTLQAPLLAGLLLCAGSALGNVATHTTFNHTTLAPQVISFTYDALNRLKTKTVPAVGTAGSTPNTVTYAHSDDAGPAFRFMPGHYSGACRAA
jgi:YD repeat-containing protein